MPIPESFRGRFTVPAIAAPMFLVSGPELVIATCQAGVAGTFPALNARPAAQLEEWLGRIDAALAARRREHPADPCAPYGVNLILHPSNERLGSDLATVVRHRVPIVITSLGHPGEVVRAVHEYGGLVFSDIIHAYHARKAALAGVDGIIAVADGAGGHAGTQSPFSLIREIREFWDGILVLAGAISDGASIRAAEVLGADFAYLGTRFIATRESLAPPEYKQMLVDCGADDVVYTDAISGTNANFLWPSLQRAGFSREELSVSHGKGKLKPIADEAKAWRDVWSAGQGVATIHDIPSVAELVGRLAREYAAACGLPVSRACRVESDSRG
jgi:nitronate monooxygenase